MDTNTRIENLKEPNHLRKELAGRTDGMHVVWELESELQILLKVKRFADSRKPMVINGGLQFTERM
jgi:hypothetical protein